MISLHSIFQGPWDGLLVLRRSVRTLVLLCCGVAWVYAQKDLAGDKITSTRVLWHTKPGSVPGSALLSDAEILELVGPWSGMRPLSLRTREEHLKESPYLLKADLCYGMDGQVQVHVLSRRPVLRVVPEGMSGYYLDELGQGLPLSKSFAEPMPLVLGQVPLSWAGTGQLLHPGLHLVHRCRGVIARDSLLAPRITQYVVRGKDSSALELGTPLGQRIWVGTAFDLQHKLQKLSAFYRHAPQDSSPDRFQYMNLLFKNQIVCR